MENINNRELENRILEILEIINSEISDEEKIKDLENQVKRN
nr:hypothetical protein [uncultured Romboutsia sp.]